MNTSDRRLLDAEYTRGIAMLKVGDREGTIALLRRLRSLVTGRDPDAVERLAVFHCLRLDGELTHQACVDRQAENEKNLRRRRTRAETPKEPSRWVLNRYRGKCPEHPSCVTEQCAQGRAIRARVAGDGNQ